MINVAIYHSSIPNQKNQEKVDLLRHFSEGVRVVGDKRFDMFNNDCINSDVGVIQGWVDGPATRKHLALRYQVINQQLAAKKYVVAVDSNLFLYATPNNPQHYLRYSFNGIFPNTGIYCDDQPDPQRWEKIRKHLGIQVKDYRTSGNHVLLLLQRNGGWSMNGLDVQDWANSIITQIRKHTDRPIVVRAHPGDSQAKHYLARKSPLCKIKFSKAVTLSENTSLVADLENCWAAINYNSSPTVGAALEGVPIFVTDPDRSQCAKIANIDLTQIESPVLFDRQAWLERLAMSHWNFQELKSGECWRHMRQYVKL
jgi:hypothetical protein